MQIRVSLFLGVFPQDLADQRRVCAIPSTGLRRMSSGYTHTPCAPPQIADDLPETLL